MRRLLALIMTGVLAVLLTACGSSGASSQPVSQRLQEAKAFIDNSDAFNFTLSTTSVPSGVIGVLSASGEGTHQPGFQGTIKVSAAGLAAQVDVTAVDGKVWAKAPILGLNSPQIISASQLAQYGAPDPAALMSKTTGITSLLTTATGFDAGKQTRDGSVIVTTYTGTIPGADVAKLIPVANNSAAFTVVFSLTSDNHLQTASLTGPFFASAGNTTYTVTMTTCADCKPVVAPTS